MIITTDSLKSAICRRKTWLAYDYNKMIAKMSEEISMRELISAYDKKYVGISDYSNYSTRDYTTSRYLTYSDIVISVYRPIDLRSIHVNYPNLRSDIGTYYWGS